MKSGKQRRRELKARRQRKREKIHAATVAEKAERGVAVVVTELAPCNSYGVPRFVVRGYYVDVDFTCVDCGVQQVWTASQQKWWYEVAKGYVYSTASRCRACRRQERERREAARRAHLRGLADKRQRVAE